MTLKIKDIAEDAGVSIATVSRVLNNSQPVSKELRERVMSSVNRLGYRPNILARGLRMKRTFVVGIIVPNISNAYFTDIVRAAEDVALEAGYVVTVASSDQDLVKERRYVDVLRNRLVDGALVAVAHRFESDLTPLTEADVPVVLVDRRLEGCTDCDSVTVDVRQGAHMAVTHLALRGYRRIGLIGGPLDVSTAADKLEGYRQALAEHGLPVDESLILMGDYTEASGVRLGREILQRQDPPEAMLVANNLMTLGFFRVVKEFGLRVPHDIAFASFDDSAWASIVTPPVTLVNQPTYEVGKAAMELLLDRLEEDDAHRSEPKHQVLRPTLIVRGSS